MEPKNLKRFLSTVQKPSFREYLDPQRGTSLSKALEEKLAWAKDNDDKERQGEADFLTNNRANLRSMVATMAVEEDAGDEEEAPLSVGAGAIFGEV